MCMNVHTQISWYFLKSALITEKFTKLYLRKYFQIGRSITKLIVWDDQSMEYEDILMPPIEVRGMKALDRKLFSKTIEVPWIVFPVALYSKCLKKYMLKLEKLKPLQDLGERDSKMLTKIKLEVNVEEKKFKKMFLNPLIVKCFEDINVNDRTYLEKHGITKEHFQRGPVTLTYDNWKADEVLKSVLPIDIGALTSYSKIGHIVHVNLKENLLEYKNVIGQVLLDKVTGARTIVNKTDAIDSTYRNFQMELLCGENDMKAQVRENRCLYEFDFSLVYWNPRLCTEHERILSLLCPGDVLFDVFAGVGPFSIPAARHRRCSLVMANDLNPDSYLWLVHNVSLNKVLKENFKYFNKDGWKFIVEDIAHAVQQRWENALEKNIELQGKMHVVMNLPGRAMEFLGAFCGMFINKKHLRKMADKDPFTIHIYCFVPVDNSHLEAVNLVEANIGVKPCYKDVAFVRKVSPSKEMLRVTFELSAEVLFSNVGEKLPQPSPKRICLEKTGERG